MEEKNFILQKQINDLKEELSFLYFLRNFFLKIYSTKKGRKQQFISQTMVRQQVEMSEIRTLMNNLRFQAEGFPLFFMPFARMFNPISQAHVNLVNLDDMSYEVYFKNYFNVDNYFIFKANYRPSRKDWLCK